MHTYLLFTGSGPVVILTSHGALDDAALLDKLAARGLTKFLAYRIPLELAKARYGRHFEAVSKDVQETDDLRMLDLDGSRAFYLFRFAELEGPFAHEGPQPAPAAYAASV